MITRRNFLKAMGASLVLAQISVKAVAEEVYSKVRAEPVSKFMARRSMSYDIVTQKTYISLDVLASTDGKYYDKHYDISYEENLRDSKENRLLNQEAAMYRLLNTVQDETKGYRFTKVILDHVSDRPQEIISLPQDKVLEMVRGKVMGIIMRQENWYGLFS